jgi:hypothetical protein
LLKLIEAEAISTNPKYENPQSNSPMSDGNKEKYQDGLETKVGIIIIIGIVFDVFPKIDDKYDQNTHIEYDKGSQNSKIHHISFGRGLYLWGLVVVKVNIRYRKRRG